MKTIQTKGAALLTVLIALMIISIVLFEFQYASTVERQLAYNDLSQMKTYYLAKAGARMGLLRVIIYGKAMKQCSSDSAIASSLGLIWSLPLPAFPPARESLQDLDAPDKSAAETVLQQTKVTEGSVSHVITSESSKINLNMLVLSGDQKAEDVNCRDGTPGIVGTTCKALVDLIEGFIRESENPYEEYGNLKSEELVMDILDWVNEGSRRTYGGEKDGYYQQQVPPYRAKRTRFFTLEELRLVRGIDDHLFEKLKPHITVYSGDGLININNASSKMYQTFFSPPLNDRDLEVLMAERDKRGGWSDVNALITYIANNLNAQSIRDKYKQPSDSFTVETKSFMIESMGSLTKNKVQTQKLIRIGLGSVPSTLVKGKGSKAECEKDPCNFWNELGAGLQVGDPSQCGVIPKNGTECANKMPGATWTDTAKGGTCTSTGSNRQSVTYSRDVCKASGSGALKIFYWSET